MKMEGIRVELCGFHEELGVICGRLDRVREKERIKEWKGIGDWPLSCVDRWMAHRIRGSYCSVAMEGKGLRLEWVSALFMTYSNGNSWEERNMTRKWTEWSEKFPLVQLIWRIEWIGDMSMRNNDRVEEEIWGHSYCSQRRNVPSE